MQELVLVAPKSDVRIHTFAEGMFARLAHDLELVCRGLRGTAARAPAAGGGAIANVIIPLATVDVAGVLERGKVDDSRLSPADRRDCLDKMRREAFHAGPDDEIRIDVSVDGSRARLRIVPPNGRTVELTARPDIQDDGDGVRVVGKLDLSLEALGSDVIRGPMGAFRVKDRVAVSFELLFAPPRKNG